MPAVNEIEQDPGVEVQWRAFELRPDPAPLPDAQSDYFKKMWEESIFPLAESLDVPIKMPLAKPRSRHAHRLAKWADSLGHGKAVREAIFHSYFLKGQDIGETEVLEEVVSESGLDVSEFAKMLESDLFLGEVVDDEEDAGRIGISGVPAFVADRKAGLMGIRSTEAIRNLIEQVSRKV